MEYIGSNPANGAMKRLPKSKKYAKEDIEVVTPDQIDHILSTCRQYKNHYYPLIFCAFRTGMRLGELANLRWESVDLIQKKIKVQIYDDFITKNRRERILPINKNIITDLRLLSKTRKSEYVFSNDNNYKYNSSYISHKFKKIVRQIGLPERIRFHTLRHSFASNLVQKGANLYAVKELLGHENISTTQIYAHLDSKTLENTVELL